MDTPLSLTHPTIPLSHYPTTPPSPPANAFLSIPPGEGGGGGKSLHEQLMANKDKKDAEWEENFAASRAPRGLDEEDGFMQVDEAHEFTVSLMNKRLLAMSNADSMAKLDWVALVLCAYVVGLNVAGEIKDIQLCEMAYTARVKELTVPWQVALAVLGRVRGQVFLAVKHT